MRLNINGTENRRVAKAMRMKGAGGMGFLLQQANNAMDAGVWDQIKNDAAEGTARDMTHLNKVIGRENAEIGQANAKELWDYTNAENQANHLEKAGLNKALMYGGGGTGGATTSGAPTPQSSGGTATRAGDSGSGMGMIGAQAGLIDANTKLAEAQTRNVDADTANKPKVGTNIDANTGLTNVQAGIAGIQKAVAEDTKTDQVLKIQAEAGKLQGEMNSAIANGKIADATTKTQIQQAKADLTGTYIKNQLNIAGIKYTEAQTKAVADSVAAAYINAYANQRNAGSNEDNANTNMINQIRDAMYKNGVLELGDRKLTQDMIMGIMGIITGKMPTTTSTEQWGEHGEFRGGTTSTRQ